MLLKKKQLKKLRTENSLNKKEQINLQLLIVLLNKQHHLLLKRTLLKKLLPRKLTTLNKQLLKVLLKTHLQLRKLKRIFHVMFVIASSKT